MAASACIALYRPHEGQDESLRTLIAEHLPALRKEGLVTDRAAFLLQAKDGTYLEIFEWIDETAAQRAHESASIGRIWGAMAEVADMTTLADIEESKTRFPHFKPVDL
ncbi:MAG: hypothetical protein V3W41_05880 [Planctomycetota bacterium]